MRRTEIGFIAGAAVAVGALLWFLKRKRRTEDRPAMTVKSGSIVFETGGLDWRDGGGGTWEPDHDEGKDVRLFVASVSGADGKCADLVGKRLTITYTDESLKERDRQFRVHLANAKPKISPKGLLTRDPGRKKLSHGRSNEGYISKIESDRGDSCTISSENAEIVINYEYL